MTNGWDDWEDYNEGMYERRAIRESMVVLSVDLLSDPDQFLEVGAEMVRVWGNAARQNLVNISTGKQAWIGQASCCYAHGATAEETKAAWGRMSNWSQVGANRVADVIEGVFLRGRNDAKTLFGD